MKLKKPDTLFYVSWDNISTTTKWSRPTKELCIRWRDRLLDIHDLNNMNIYLVGSFCEYLNKTDNLFCSDIDVNFVIHEPYDYDRIKLILDDSLKIATDVGIHIDQCACTPYTHNFYQRCHEGELPEYCDNKLITFKNYKYFKKIVNDEIRFDIELKGFTEIQNVSGLYKMIGIRQFIANKIIHKVKKGIHKGAEAIDLKTLN